MSDSVTSTLEEVQIITERTLEDLLNKWHTMYIVTEDIKAQRLAQFLSHLKDFYVEMLQSEENRKNNYLKEIERKLNECQHLEKALSVTIDCGVDSSHNPLIEVIKHLDDTLKKFEEVKMERINKLSNLKNKEVNLCRILGTKELVITNVIPTEDDINRLEHQLFIFEEEKLKRMEEFRQHRDNIVEYIQKLEVSTLLDFEKSLVETDEILSLTSEDMSKIRDVNVAYKKQFESARTKVEYMFEILKKLWNRLDIDDNYRSRFMERHTGVGRKTLEDIQAEIQQCEDIRRELVEPLIKKNRTKIVELCERLCYTENQQEKYLYRNSPISEDVLDALELEVGKLEILCEENSEMLDLIVKQRDMWERKLELEEAAKDKARLFNNRGGQLLREEKERKTIELTFPKLTKKLENMLISYEERTGSPFLFFGENLLLKIRDDRELNDITRLKVNKKPDSKIPGSASKVREKRKLNGLVTPKSEKSKRLKLTSSTTSLASSSSKNSAKSAEGRCRTRSRIALFKDQDTSVASSYSLFQEEIEEKKRSTTMCNPERQPLKNINSPVLPFLSSPTSENTPRFHFRSRPNQSIKNSSQMQSNGKLSSSKQTFATPKAMMRSATRLATPKQVYSSNRSGTPGINPLSKTRNYFDTSKSAPRSGTKTGSVIKPARFHFNI